MRQSIDDGVFMMYRNSQLVIRNSSLEMVAAVT